MPSADNFLNVSKKNNFREFRVFREQKKIKFCPYAFLSK